MKARLLTLLCLMMVMALLVPGGVAPTLVQSQPVSFVVPALSEAEASPPTPDQAQVTTALRDAPVMFIENVSQFNEHARFQVRGANGAIWLADDAIWITVFERTSEEGGGSGRDTPPRFRASALQSRRGVNLKLSFVGANPRPLLEPFNHLDTHVSYFIGNDPAKWHSGVSAWGGVRYVNLYPGVTLEVTSEEGRWAWRLVAGEGAELSAVRLRAEGADALALNDDCLRLTTAVGDFTLPLPTIEGVTPDSQPAIFDVEREMFDVTSPFFASSSLPRSLSSHPLAPASLAGASDLLYSTFLGGNGDDREPAIAVDGASSAYVTGYTYSPDFPTTPGAFDTSLDGLSDAFVVKVSADGTGLAYATFLGGSGGEQGLGVAVDGAGNSYVTGYTRSPDFPTTPGAFDTTHNGADDAFVVKLNADGTELVYATFLGGSDGESDSAIAVDGGGSAYVTGSTLSTNFPATAGGFDTTHNGHNDAFVVKLNADGTELAYATFLGAGSVDRGNAIAVDGAGSAYVTGSTLSTNFPTTAGGFDTTHNGHNDAFVVKLNADGTGLAYATFLGGSSIDGGLAIAVDGTGSAYVTGHTLSSDFPTTAGTFDTSLDGGYDAFVVKVSADGTGLAYATFLGGSGGEQGWGVAVDGPGNAYVTGHTASTNFPTTSGAFDTSLDGSCDAFLVKVNVDGTGLTYATFLGGSDNDYGHAIAIDGSGSAHMAGDTWSSDFPTTAGAFDTSHDGSRDVFVAKLDVGPPCDLSKQPVLLVHGWGGPDAMADDEVGFAQLSKWMLADGYVEGCNLFYATGVRASNNRIFNAIAIQLNLRAVYNTITALNPDWRGHFDIIGHSYGGLNARFYLESSRYLDDASYGQYGIHVDNLFTLGSPHGGAIVPVELFPGAILIGLGHLSDEEWLSANDLLADQMDNYNDSSDQPPNVCYRLIGGDFMQQPDLRSKAWVIWRLYDIWTDIPNDIGVSRRSSLLEELGTNPDLASRYEHVVTYANTDMHGYKDMLGLGEVRSYVNPALAYNEIIAPNLGASMDRCHSSQVNTRSAVDAQSEELTIPPLLIASDIITGGQITMGTVLVDWDGQTAFYVTWMSGGDLDLTLGDPAGSVFTPTVAISDPNADYGKLMFSTSGLATYIFTNTLTGTWTYTLTAVSGPYPIPFDLYVNPDSPLVARAYALEWQPFGAPAVITASLFYSATPVSGATVQAHVTRPDGGEGSASLGDDGLPPDDAAGDGIYSGTYTDTTTGGFYYVLVEADGTYASQTYHRTAQTVFPVAANSATLSGTYADQPNDENGDGLYEYLDVSVGVNATQQGDFTVAAVFQGEGGQYIDLSNTTVYSFTGVTTLTLQFDGQAIRASGLDGPYTVTEVLLLDDADLIKLEEADDVWVTPPYDHRQFGTWSDRLYLPLILRNR